MPSLSEIPFLDRYRQREAQIRGEGLDELKQFSTLAQLHGQMQAQAEKQKAAQREGQYRAEVAALGPNPTQEQLVTIASRFGGPEKVMDVHQKSLDRRNAVEIAAASRNPPADNRPEILRLIEIHDGLPEGHPNRERILGRITYLNEGRPPAEKEAWGEPYELGGAWVQRSDKGNVRQVVGRAPQTRVDVPAPVTAVTIQDPNDPNGTIVINGRTQQPLGKGPKLTDVGKVDQKNVQNLPGAKLHVQATNQNLDRLNTAIQELHDSPGLSNITGTVSGRTWNLTNAATGAQAKLDSIKSQTFVSALQAMREASKTGGAVGNVSDREGDRLENTIAALGQAQSTADFKAQLKKAQAQLKLSKQLIQNAFDEQYGNLQAPSGQPQNRRATDDPLGLRKP